MDPELERWKAGGQYFDYLGFDVFYRTAGSGPPLLLIHGYPFNSWDWAPIWDNADRTVHCDRPRHARDGVLRQARRL